MRVQSLNTDFADDTDYGRMDSIQSVESVESVVGFLLFVFHFCIAHLAAANAPRGVSCNLRGLCGEVFLLGTLRLARAGRDQLLLERKFRVQREEKLVLRVGLVFVQ